MLKVCVASFVRYFKKFYATYHVGMGARAVEKALQAVIGTGLAKTRAEACTLLHDWPDKVSEDFREHNIHQYVSGSLDESSEMVHALCNLVLKLMDKVDNLTIQVAHMRRSQELGERSGITYQRLAFESQEAQDLA
jgi:hypothetical protein